MALDHDRSGGPAVDAVDLSGRQETGVDNDDLFGIDLGPGVARTKADGDELPAPVKARSKTLTERLAQAAADRADSDSAT